VAPPLKPIAPGERFGKLLVLRFAYRTAKSEAYYHVRCDCGDELQVAQKHLRGGVRSCRACGRTTHGMVKAPEYSVWHNMRRRCAEPSSASYAYYGARGIAVCERWASFENFFADMGPRPSPEHTIDRKDSGGNYEPGNCRWATRGEQARNRSDNRLLTFGDETLCLSDWATRLGIAPDTIDGRLRRGWPVERAVTEPPHRENRNHR